MEVNTYISKPYNLISCSTLIDFVKGLEIAAVPFDDKKLYEVSCTNEPKKEEK